MTAAEATAQFFSAITANDIDAAIAMTAPMKDVPEEAIRNKYQKWVEFTKKTRQPQIIAHLQLNQTAIVVLREFGEGKENRIDLDPAYLIMCDDKWFVTFEFTEFDQPYHGFDEATLVSFYKLQEWFKSQKPLLQDLLRDSP